MNKKSWSTTLRFLFFLPLTSKHPSCILFSDLFLPSLLTPLPSYPRVTMNNNTGRTPAQCGHCGLTGHSRVNSVLCPKNPKQPKRPRSPSPTPTLPIPPTKKQKQEQRLNQCVRCGLTGHARANSSLCPMNPKRPQRPCSSSPTPNPPVPPAPVPVPVQRDLSTDPEERPLSPEPEFCIPAGQRHKAAFVEREEVARYSMGRMDRTCPFCNARLWIEVHMFLLPALVRMNILSCSTY